MERWGRISAGIRGGIRHPPSTPQRDAGGLARRLPSQPPNAHPQEIHCLRRQLYSAAGQPCPSPGRRLSGSYSVISANGMDDGENDWKFKLEMSDQIIAEINQSWQDRLCHSQVGGGAGAAGRPLRTSFTTPPRTKGHSLGDAPSPGHLTSVGGQLMSVGGQPTSVRGRLTSAQGTSGMGQVRV